MAPVEAPSEAKLILKEEEVRQSEHALDAALSKLKVAEHSGEDDVLMEFLALQEGYEHVELTQAEKKQLEAAESRLPATTEVPRASWLLPQR